MSPISAPGTIPRSVRELPDKFEELLREMREFRRETNQKFDALIRAGEARDQKIDALIQAGNDRDQQIKQILDEMGKLRRDMAK